MDRHRLGRPAPPDSGVTVDEAHLRMAAISVIAMTGPEQGCNQLARRYLGPACTRHDQTDSSYRCYTADDLRLANITADDDVDTLGTKPWVVPDKAGVVEVIDVGIRCRQNLAATAGSPVVHRQPATGRSRSNRCRSRVVRTSPSRWRCAVFREHSLALSRDLCASPLEGFYDRWS